MTSMLTTQLFRQAAETTGTPAWVILIVVFLVLILFLWGATNSSGIRGKTEDSEGHDEIHEPHATESEAASDIPLEDAAG